MKISTEVRHFMKVTAWVVIPCSIAFALFPTVLKVPFTNEDRLIEMSAVFLYVLAFLSTLFIWRKGKDIYVRGVGLFLSVVTFILIMEETSFGRNMIYKYERPKLFDAGIDTFHDIFLVIAYGIRDYNSPIAYGIAIVIISFIGFALRYFFTKQKTHTLRFLQTLTFRFFALAFILLVIGAIIDATMSSAGTRHLQGKFLEEMLELFAAYSVYYGITLFRRDHFTQEIPR